MSRGRFAAIVIAAVVIALGLSRTTRADEFIQNGSFELNGGNGQMGYNTTVTDWSVPAPSGSYTMVYAPASADTAGAISQYGDVVLWGPGSGSNNGLPATSPDGGYYLAEDGDFQVGAISQTVG